MQKQENIQRQLMQLKFAKTPSIYFMSWLTSLVHPITTATKTIPAWKLVEVVKTIVIAKSLVIVVLIVTVEKNVLMSFAVNATKDMSRLSV